MPSVIETQLKKIVANAFRGQLYNGTLRRETILGTDESGDPVFGTPQTWTFNGIRDNINAYYAGQIGVPATDVRILVIAGSLPDAVEVLKDDKIFIRSQWYQVRQILERDPANATFSLSGFTIDDPVDEVDVGSILMADGENPMMMAGGETPISLAGG